MDKVIAKRFASKESEYLTKAVLEKVSDLDLLLVCMELKISDLIREKVILTLLFAIQAVIQPEVTDFLKHWYYDYRWLNQGGLDRLVTR